jgi:hypothetical protein
MTFENEKHVKREVKKLLDKYGWFWWMPPANGYGATGVADFNALKNGVFLAVETKFGTNKPTPRQKAYAESVAAMQGFAFCVNERNLEWLDRWLLAFGNASTAVLRNKGTDPRQAVDQADGADLLNAMHALMELWH